MIETYGIKVDLESLEKACQGAGGYPKNSSYATAIYYDEETGRVWKTQFVDKENDRIEGEHPIVYCTDKGITPQGLMDRIKEHLDEMARMYKDTARMIYADGWRAADREEIKKLYQMDDEWVDTICRLLEEIEQG